MRGRLRTVLRVGGTTLAVIVVSALAALEVWYRLLLPAKMPQPTKRTMPELLSRTLWAYDFRGDGDPRLHPIFPFIVGSVVRGPEASQNLAAGVARFYGQRERALHYTLHQIALATWISRNWSTDDAINTYASQLWMGNDHLGAEDGAMRLFGKAVEQLSVSETALLVAIARSPRQLDPFCHAERATDARQVVLERMRATGLISDRQFTTAVAAPLGVSGACEDHDAARRPTSG
jgi:transglycosylase-like protein